MAKKLIDKTWSEIQKEMSIAGEPDKAVEFGKEVEELAIRMVNTNNLPSVDSIILALDKVKAGLKHWRNKLQKIQHP